MKNARSLVVVERETNTPRNRGAFGGHSDTHTLKNSVVVFHIKIDKKQNDA